MNSSYDVECGLLYRGQIRGYLDDLKVQLSHYNISCDYTEIKSLLDSKFIFRAYNMSAKEVIALDNAWNKWREKVYNFLNS